MEPYDGAAGQPACCSQWAAGEPIGAPANFYPRAGVTWRSRRWRRRSTASGASTAPASR